MSSLAQACFVYNWGSLMAFSKKGSYVHSCTPRGYDTLLSQCPQLQALVIHDTYSSTVETCVSLLDLLIRGWFLWMFCLVL